MHATFAALLVSFNLGQAALPQPMIHNFAEPTEPAAAAPAPRAVTAVASQMPSLPLPPKLRQFDKAGDFFVGASGTAAALGGQNRSSNGTAFNGFVFRFDANAGYFIRQHWAIGGRFGLDATAASGTRKVEFGIGPQITARLFMPKHVTFLPSLALMYQINHQKAGAAKLTDNAFVMDFDMPFLFELAHGVGITAGPYIKPLFGTVSSATGTNGLLGVDYGIRIGVLAWM